ncbi:MAG: hypothetical protein JO051_11400 [Acidobacteriaceae bacterium]|nr:hypothetical protein [Acidobacteriaceae bacterium]
MSRHLSSNEISDWILKHRTVEAEQHLDACADCRAEVAAFETTLLLFRASAHTWTDRQLASETQTLRRIQQAPFRNMVQTFGLAAAMTVVCVLSVLSIRQRSFSSAPVVAAAAELRVGDAALLERVDGQISQTIPSSLAPLDNALSWETASRATARR